MLALAAGSCGSGEAEPDAVVELAPYRSYLTESAASLVRAVQAMQPELENDEVARAGSRYARARVYYSQVEPAAELSPVLDARINALPGAVPAKELGGFAAIERSLFEAGSAVGTAAIGRRLIADTKELRKRIEAASFSATQLAAGAAGILEEISEVTLADREQVYAGADLVDVSANLEAVGAAYRALKPALTEEERQEIRTLLRHAYAGIAEYGTPARDPDQSRDRSPGAIFVVFDELTRAEVEELRRQSQALGEAFLAVRDRLTAG